MPGCIGCGVYRTIEKESVVLFERCWRNHKNKLHPLRSEDYQKLRLIIAMAMNKPEM